MAMTGADITKISLANQKKSRDSRKFGMVFWYPVFFSVSSTINGELEIIANVFCFLNKRYCCRAKDKLFPPVKAHSETIKDKEENVSEEIANEEEIKKKKHRREKIGFRDRKVQ